MRNLRSSLSLVLTFAAASCSESSGTVTEEGVVEAEQEATLDGTTDSRLVLNTAGGGMVAQLNFRAGSAPAGTVVKATLRSGVIKLGATPAGNRVVVLRPSTLMLNQPAVLNMSQLSQTPPPGKIHKVLFAKEGAPQWTIKDLVMPPVDDTMPPPPGISTLIDSPGVWGIVELDDATPIADGGSVGETDASNGGPDGGSATWTPLVSGVVDSIGGVWTDSTDPASPVFAATQKGIVLRSMDRGATFAPLTTPTTNDFGAVWGSAPFDVYASASSNVFHSTDMGATWTMVASMPPAGTLKAIGGNGPDLVYFVGNAGTILTTLDRGRMATTRISGTTNALNAVASRGGSAIAVGDLGTILSTTDAGMNWTNVSDASVKANLNGAWDSGTVVWVVGDGGTILKMMGVVGVPGPMVTTARLRAVWGDGADIYIVGDGGTILHSSDGGNSFTRESGGTATLRSVWGSGVEVYAAGDMGTILKRPIQ